MDARDDRVSVCFVCLGNICRSPTAEAVMRHLVADAGLGDRFEIDSAGTGGWHVGEPSDARAAEEAARRGITMDGRARQLEVDDFSRFDLLVAMDGQNRRNMLAMAPDEEAASRVRMLREFDPAAAPGAEVPDPYYGGDRGFVDVFDMVDAACRGLLAELSDRLET
ncbi:MAG: low molecular weight protein-tyrosine-phosphatase [Actinomycetota bacterium]|nr:low molecular weight protein-tyrosine-phosphatase [Actinomycetota bacterium]